MKKEPGGRLGIFMSPKISENPADSRNRRPPSVMLLIASNSVTLMPGGLRARSALQRRIVARVDGLGQKPLLVVGPELAHLGIGLDRRVDQLVTLLLHPANVEAADTVAQVVEAERPPRRVGERHGAQGLVER